MTVAPREEDLGTLREALGGSPQLAERTRAMLRGELSAPDAEDPRMPSEAHLTMRLPAALVARAEHQAKALSASTGLSVTRSQVLRLAIERGLDVLEREHGKPKGRR